ncbi:MAG TPA: type II toxin-antitoxin system RelE/ParE family toxin [Methylosinus sp.]|uniref:type II toxin-antitoxin system RelE/ParE family toxin n=1 Tax=Methylosinus sp. TaxID=427 RepID=UPI002F94E40B
MRIFKTRWFARFARKEKITDSRLAEAIVRAEKGGVDATLGASLIKQRVARDGGGKSGGFRTIVAFRASTRSVFLYGFAKNVRENVEPAELEMLKKLAQRFLAMTDAELDLARAEGEVIEVGHDGEEKIS